VEVEEEEEEEEEEEAEEAGALDLCVLASFAVGRVQELCCVRRLK
jgi:hypothetical protein